MLDFFQSVSEQGISLVRQVGVLVAVGMVVLTLIVTRGQLAKVLGTVFVVGLALWAISPSGLGWLDQRIEEDAAKASFAPAPDEVLQAADLTEPVVVEVPDSAGTAGA